MTTDTPSFDSADDSDASYAPQSDDGVSDVEEPLDHETDLTDADELSPRDTKELDSDLDLEDQVQLFGGNVHPPDYYLRALNEFNHEVYASQDYSPGSVLLLDAMEQRWHEFCKFVGRDVSESYESLSIELLYTFFDWRLNQKVGKDGRVIRGTKKKSSLSTYWKVFRLVFDRATGRKIDGAMNRGMHTVLRDLAKKHGLSDEKRENRCMTIDDLKEQIKTTISTTKKSFKLGELRILAVLFLLLLAPAGARPASILSLRFGDLRVVLVKDPTGGPPRLLIRFTLAFTKTYLGVKDANTFSIPETFFDDSLFLNPHVFLLGILFRHKAFRARTLTSPQNLDRLIIHPEERELLLPLKSELDNVPVFRRAAKTLSGYKLSPTEPISYQMMASWIRSIGEALGLEYPTIPYNLRYNAANEFDQSGDMSDALRNLALGHANSGPFQRHYLGRQVTADTWAILRGEKPQQALMKQACSVGHSVSKRRPTELTSEQAASVNTDPNIRRLQRQLRDLPQGSDPYRKIRLKLKSEKERLKRELKLKVRAEWTPQQAVDDIEAQLKGYWQPRETTDTCSDHQQPIQKRLVEALSAPSDDTLEGHYRRRSTAIDAVIAYCSVEERPTMRQPTISAEKPDQEVAGPNNRGTHIDDRDSRLRLALRSVLVSGKAERPRRCFVCVGKALSLVSDDTNMDHLLREFYTTGDLTKHFRRRHLSCLQTDDKVYCDICKKWLNHKMHFRNHAERLHGLKS